MLVVPGEIAPRRYGGDKALQRRQGRGRSPVGNSYHAGLDEPTAKFLQETAWETVREYYGK
jgi:hypothetical protein